MTLCLCGGVFDASKLNPSNYFHLGHPAENNGLEHHHHSKSPYLYSPSAPMGPSRCEYCGNADTDGCTSNLPADYRMFGDNSSVVGGSIAGGSEDRNDSEVNDAAVGKRGRNYPDSCDFDRVCPRPRPKLFFLKKKPPFATPDGWNPVTEYREAMFELPSSMEGMGRGWGKVRGHLGSNAGTQKEEAAVATRI